jgi:RHS repeat-associated protein
VSVAVTYDGYARLTSYARTGDATQVHVYNGLDDRVATTLSGATRRFVYDVDGRAMGEYGTSATDVKAEFIWLMPEAANDNQPFGGDDGIGGYAPLAVAIATATPGTTAVQWVHSNHLGVPLAYTDTAGATTLSTGYNAPGFPGQQRTHADLYYNRYRDYDPVTSRYIQADPIGLGGGSNNYLYAGANPVNAIDPDGLNPTAVRGAVVVGEVAGGGLSIWCRSNLALCMRTIGPAAIKVAKLCKELSDSLSPDRCETAKAEARNAYSDLTARIRAYNTTRTPDAGHYQAIEEAKNRLRSAIAGVRKNCRILPLELPRWESVVTLPVFRRHRT